MIGILAVLYKFKNRWKSTIIETLSYPVGLILFIDLCLLLLGVFTYTLLYSFRLLYLAIFSISSIFLSNEVSIYLSLSGAFILGAYLPEKVGFIIINCIGKL